MRTREAYTCLSNRVNNESCKLKLAVLESRGFFFIAPGSPDSR